MVIPTAVVLSKGDKLKELPYFQEESRRAVVTHPDWRGIHSGYIEKREIQELDAQVRGFLQAVGEQAILNSCRGILAQASFFLMSALGKAPVITQLDPSTRSVQIEGGLNPYRVTEPFYWLLMKNDLICCHEQETFQDRKKQTKTFDIWYYDDESQESLEMRKKQIRAQMGGKTGFLARFFGER